MDDGELIVAPTLGTEFNGPTLPHGWHATPWQEGGGAFILDGWLTVDGARVGSCTDDAFGNCTDETPNYMPGRSLEFVATFTGDAFQHAGLAVSLASGSEQWAIFSTLQGGSLHVRTNNGQQGGSSDVFLGSSFMGQPHRYRIDWHADGSVSYYIDDIHRHTSPILLSGPMRPVAASDFNALGGAIFVDWIRLSPYAGAATFHSRVFDAQETVAWNSIVWSARTNASSTVEIAVRGGNTPVPDATWSDFAPAQGGSPLNLQARYIQYEATLSTTDPDFTPVLEDIIISTGHTPVAMPDSVVVQKGGSYTFPAASPGSLTANDTDADVNDTLRVVAVSAPANGTATLHADGSVTYTPAALYTGFDAFLYTVSDGLLTSSALVTIDVREGNLPPVSANDFYVMNEDTTLVVPPIGVLSNDSDPDGDPLTAALPTRRTRTTPVPTPSLTGPTTASKIATSRSSRSW
jgi:hypothetical protein